MASFIYGNQFAIDQCSLGIERRDSFRDQD